MRRRQFLKFAGATSLAGCAAPAIGNEPTSTWTPDPETCAAPSCSSYGSKSTACNPARVAPMTS